MIYDTQYFDIYFRGEWGGFNLEEKLGRSKPRPAPLFQIKPDYGRYAAPGYMRFSLIQPIAGKLSR